MNDGTLLYSSVFSLCWNGGRGERGGRGGREEEERDEGGICKKNVGENESYDNEVNIIKSSFVPMAASLTPSSVTEGLRG